MPADGRLQNSRVVPDASTSEQPRRPQLQIGPSGSSARWRPSFRLQLRGRMKRQHSCVFGGTGSSGEQEACRQLTWARLLWRTRHTITAMMIPFLATMRGHSASSLR